jgi:hypothetical protein
MYKNYGLRIKSKNHICQDALCQGRFTAKNGETVWLGAIADGCSRVLGSEHGAQYLTEKFAEIAEELYNSGEREDDLQTNVMLKLLDSMLDYAHVCPNSEITQYGKNQYSSELYATFHGYIADNDHVLIFLSGDGYIGINGQIDSIDQNKETMYPVRLMAFPRNEWSERLNLVCLRAIIDAQKFQSLILSTDGLSYNPQHSKLMNEPIELIRLIAKEANAWPFPKHRKDDTACIILTKEEAPCLPLSKHIMPTIREVMSELNYDDLLSEAGYPEEMILQKQDGIYHKKNSLYPNDYDVRSDKAHILYFGLTQQELEEVTGKKAKPIVTPEETLPAAAVVVGAAAVVVVAAAVIAAATTPPLEEPVISDPIQTNEQPVEEQKAIEHDKLEEPAPDETEGEEEPEITDNSVPAGIDPFTNDPDTPTAKKSWCGHFAITEYVNNRPSRFEIDVENAIFDCTDSPYESFVEWLRACPIIHKKQPKKKNKKR